jgi:serine/threonine-protein kinase RsbW
VRVGPRKARLAVADDGPGFDWRAALAADTRDTATCGRGLKIYALYADRVSFNEAGNRVVLERWLGRVEVPRAGCQVRG